MSEIIVLRRRQMADVPMPVAWKRSVAAWKPAKPSPSIKGCGSGFSVRPLVTKGMPRDCRKSTRSSLPFRAHQQHGIDTVPVDEAAAHVEFALAARHGRDDEVEAGGGQMFRAAGKHVEEMRRADMAGLARQGDGDKLGALLAQPARRSVGLIADLVRRIPHALACGRRHVGIAVERPRNRRDRQSQRLGELLQIGHASSRSRSILQNVLEIKPKRFGLPWGTNFPNM